MTWWDSLPWLIRAVLYGAAALVALGFVITVVFYVVLLVQW